MELTIGNLKDGVIDLYASTSSSFSYVTTDPSSGYQIEVDDSDDFVLNVNKMAIDIDIDIDSGGILNFGGRGTAIGDLSGTTSLYEDSYGIVTADSDWAPLTVSGQTTTNVYAQMPNDSSSVWIGDQTPNVYDQAQPGTSRSSDPHEFSITNATANELDLDTDNVPLTVHGMLSHRN